MSAAPARIGERDLTAFATALLVAAGVSAAMAEAWAEALVWANLRGVDSHGVLRIPRYVELLQKGTVNPSPVIRVERRVGAIAVLEADLAPGPIAMMRAMDEALTAARTHGLGWCAARNITHAGAVGYVALRAAEAGFIGIAMTASGPMMAYPGTRTAALSTNPLTIAFPAGRRRPFLLDMSTSTAALGKVLSARDAGRSIPLGWGIDRNGHDTSDPKAVETLLPLGGPKGAGLSFMIECLCSLTTGNPIISAALEAGGSLDAPYLNGATFAIDLAAFGDPAAIRAEADRMGDALLKLPKADGADHIFLPGERGDSVRMERERDGIVLAVPHPKTS